MFQNARNIRISGTPTFQNINGSYHYHDHTSNTTNNNTTTITGNDFSQTVHNHNTYTIEGGRRSYSQPEESSGVPQHTPQAPRPPTIHSLPNSQHISPPPDTQVFHMQPYPHRFITKNPMSATIPYTYPSLGGAAYGFHEGHHMAASILPGHIVAMSPEVSLSLTQFFRKLEDQVSCEKTRDAGTITDTDLDMDGDGVRDGSGDGEQVYQDTVYQSHPTTAPPPQLTFERSGAAHIGVCTQVPQTGNQWEWATPHQPAQQPLPQNSHLQNQDNDTNAPYTSYTPVPNQFNLADQQPNANSNLNANSNSNSNSSSNHNHKKNPIPPRVRRTLQAAFTFNSHLGESSSSTTSSTEYDYTAASKNTTSLPFAYTHSPEAGTTHTDAVAPRMEVCDGTVVEMRRAENVHTTWDVRGDDVGRVPVHVQRLWHCEGESEGEGEEEEGEGDRGDGKGVVYAGESGDMDGRMRWTGNRSPLESMQISMGYLRV
ncbi:hypothetical protein JR316_0008603 [Psilocybe cubensis]|nr:uncharacterized protein JR316_0013515 [Psilocybe cubensis]XP_047745775.1 hypothetical protein JR316_0008603 [Psilocybe cubensis]KAH9474200.1 hypothetical protein JR316_0013515 [Psilocybe cubensis]KAH9478150.1 hypothetical protein JR316_0008603 [Psilocybe cubensis]